MIGLSRAQAAVDGINRVSSDLGLTGLNSLFFRASLQAKIYELFLSMEAHPEALQYVQLCQSRVLSELDQIRTDMPDLFDHD